MKHYDPAQREADVAFVRAKLQKVDRHIQLPDTLSAARLTAAMAQREEDSQGHNVHERDRLPRVVWLRRLPAIAATAAAVVVGVFALYRVGLNSGPALGTSEPDGLYSSADTSMSPDGGFLYARDYGEIEELLGNMVVVQDPPPSQADEPASLPESSAVSGSESSQGSDAGESSHWEPASSAPGVLPEAPLVPTQLTAPDLFCVNDTYLYCYTGGDKAGITVVGLAGLTIEGHTDAGQRAGSQMVLSGDNLILIGEERRGSTTVSTVTFFDVSDPAQPKQGRTFRQDGRLADSYLQGDDLYLVSFQQVAPTMQNVQNSIDNMVPVLSDSLTDTTGPLAVEHIAIMPHPTSPVYAVVSLLSTGESDAPVQTQATLGGADGVYRGDNGLYIWYYDETNADTDIVKVSATGRELNVYCFGQTKGRTPAGGLVEVDGNLLVINQAEGASPSLQVLDGNLQHLATLENLGGGDKIDQLWARGRCLYFTTAQSPTGLQIIDLTDPTVPTLASAAAIGGRLDAIGNLDEDRMFGIGPYLTPGGKVQGVRKVILDFTDPLQPVEASVLRSGAEGSYTPLQSDPRGLMVDETNGLVGASMVNVGVADSGMVVDPPYRDGWRYIIYRAEPGGELVPLGQLTHCENPEGFTIPDSRQNVYRAFCAGNMIYAVSASKITAHNMETLEQTGELFLI